MARTASQVDLSILQKISSNFTTADVSDGSVIKDVVADSVSPEFENAYTQIDNNQILVDFITNAETLTTEQMDNIAANYSVTRLTGTKSTGEVIFRTKTLPISTITIGNVDGSGGISVLTKQLDDGSVLRFITTATAYMLPTAVYNSLSGYYEVSAPIISENIGSKYKVASGAITVISTNINGINSCYNVISTSDSKDIETNTEIANRIAVKIQGSSKSNKAGYELIASAVSGVSQSMIVGPNDTDSVRGAGSVDVYIYGTNYASVSNEANTYATGSDYYRLLKSPAYSITSVTATVLGVPTILAQGTDYELQKDTTSIYEGSVSAVDRLFFKNLGTKPDNGTIFYTNYIYNKIVADVQAEFGSEENDMLVSDVLAKETDSVTIDIFLTIILYAGFRTQTTYDKIRALISTFISDQGPGARFSQSDLDFYLRTNAIEINDIVLPLTYFGIRGDSTQDIIQLSSKEYPILDSNSIQDIYQ